MYYVNIHISFTLNLVVTKNRGWWRKTTYIFEFSAKSSIRIRYFPSCAKKKVKFCCPVLLVYLQKLFQQQNLWYVEWNGKIFLELIKTLKGEYHSHLYSKITVFAVKKITNKSTTTLVTIGSLVFKFLLTYNYRIEF